MDPVEQVAIIGEIIWKLEKIDVFIGKLRQDGDIPANALSGPLKRISSISKRYRAIYNRIAGGDPVKRKMVKEIRALEADVRTTLQSIQRLLGSNRCFGLHGRPLAKKLPSKLKTAQTIVKRIDGFAQKIMRFGTGGGFEDEKQFSLQRLNKRYCDLLLAYFDMIKKLKENLFVHIRQRLKIGIKLIREHRLKKAQLGYEQHLVAAGTASDFESVVRKKSFDRLLALVRTLDLELNESLKPRLEAVGSITRDLETVRAKFLLYGLDYQLQKPNFAVVPLYDSDPEEFVRMLWQRSAKELRQLAKKCAKERARINAMERSLVAKHDKKAKYLADVAREFTIKHPLLILDQLPTLTCSKTVSYTFAKRYRHKFDLAVEHTVAGLNSYINVNINRLRTFLSRVRSSSINANYREKIATSITRMLTRAMAVQKDATDATLESVTALEKMSKRMIEFSLKAQEYFDTAMEKFALQVETRRQIEDWLTGLGVDRGSITKTIVLSVHPFWRKRNEILEDTAIQRQATVLKNEMGKFARALDMYSDLAVKESSSADRALERGLETDRALACLKGERRQLAELKQQKRAILDDLDDHARMIATDIITTGQRSGYREVLREADRRYQLILERLDGFQTRLETVTTLSKIEDETAIELDVEHGVSIIGNLVRYTVALSNRSRQQMSDMTVRIAAPGVYIELTDPVTGTAAVDRLAPGERTTVDFSLRIRKRTDAKIGGYITFRTPTIDDGVIKLEDQSVDLIAPFLSLHRIEPAVFYAATRDAHRSSAHAGFYVTNTDVDHIAELISDHYEHMYEVWNYAYSSAAGKKTVTIWNSGLSDEDDLVYLFIASIRDNPLTPTVDVGLKAICEEKGKGEHFIDEIQTTLMHAVSFEDPTQKVTELKSDVARTIVSDTLLKSRSRLEELGALGPEGVEIPTTKRSGSNAASAACSGGAGAKRFASDGMGTEVGAPTGATPDDLDEFGAELDDLDLDDIEMSLDWDEE